MTECIYKRVTAYLSFTLVLLAAVLCLNACRSAGSRIEKVILTNGLEEGELFRIDTISCTLSEFKLYQLNIRSRYQEVYGDRIWETELGRTVLAEDIKISALERLSQIKSMNLLASKEHMVLSEDEEQRATEAAAEYYESLSPAALEYTGVTPELVTGMYREYALADKVYRSIIEGINPEISDDEARTVSVQHIYFKTASRMADGTYKPYSEEGISNQKHTALQVLQLAREGEDFEMLAMKYNEDIRIAQSFRKGERDEVYEKAAFNLGNGEISDLIETDNGYYIIKCISTLNREETDSNKLRIVEQRKKEAFSREYDEYVVSLNKGLSLELYESVGPIENSEIFSTTFISTYSKYFD